MGANIWTANSFYLRNSIITYPATYSNVVGPITDGGHNSSSDSSITFTSGTSFSRTDPRLGPLADNGVDIGACEYSPGPVITQVQLQNG